MFIMYNLEFHTYLMFCFCLSNWILSFCPYCTYSSIITLITFGHIRVNSVTCIWSIHRNGYHQYQTLPQVTGVAPPSSFKTSHYFRGVPRRCHTYEHSPCRFSHNVCLTLWFLNVFVFRFIELSFRLCGRRRGWDVSREQHRNMYII